MPDPKVVNVRSGAEYDIYIGRPNPRIPGSYDPGQAKWRYCKNGSAGKYY